MTKAQRIAISKLFSVFGGGGSKYTKGNQHFLSVKIVGGEDAEHFQPTDECKKAFQAVMEGDWSPFAPSVRTQLKKIEKEEERLRKVSGVSYE